MIEHIEFYENGEVVRKRPCEVTADNLRIIGGWNVPKREYGYVLDEIKKAHPGCKVFNRSKASLKLEWACHSFLYQMQIARKRTADVDLNYPNKIAWLYCICGVLVWFFA